MRTREREIEPLVDLSQITELELLILKRLRELTSGEHRSQFRGSGFEVAGLRDWQAGDRVSAIDWPQSTLTNFSPVAVREFDQPSTARVVAMADASLSMRCGIDGVPIGALAARAIATIGLSAVFFQDQFGLITFDEGFRHLSAVRPRTGKGQVVHCLDAYHRWHDGAELRRGDSLGSTVSGFVRRTSLIPVISDFLFDDMRDVLVDLSFLQADHDVFIVLIDSAFAFDLPSLSAGWISAFDVETGRSRVMSRTELRRLPARVRRWQDEVVGTATNLGLDVVRFGPDQDRSDLALAEFVAERRLRKT